MRTPSESWPCKRRGPRRRRGCAAAREQRRSQRGARSSARARSRASLAQRSGAGSYVCVRRTQDVARERKAREEAEAVLADTTRVRLARRACVAVEAHAHAHERP